MDAEVTISFKLRNLIDETSLQEDFEGSLLRCVVITIKEEGICGIIDHNVKVVKVERI